MVGILLASIDFPAPGEELLVRSFIPIARGEKAITGAEAKG
jgi:hypothetical protein